MKKINHLNKIIIVIIILIIITCFVYYRRPAASPGAIPEIWVKAIKISHSKVPLEVVAIGTLVAKSVDITAESAGHVKEIYFKDGAFIKKGDPLIQFDDAIDKTKLNSAQAQLAYSEADFKRKSLLLKKGVVAKQLVDQAEADLKQKRATAEESKVLLEKLRLKAPFDGRVAKSLVNLGDYVTVGKNLVTITDTQHLRVEYSIPEKFLPLVKVGQQVKIHATAYPEKIFSGILAYVSPSINTANRSISLYASLPNLDNLLAAGMFVNVVHSLGTEEDIIIIPSRALVPILDGEQVYKVIDGKAYAVTVLLGKRLGENVQILNGLKPGDTIITDGQQKAKNNLPVKIKKS